MLKPNRLTKKLKMKKSIIILVFVFVLSQLGNAASTIENGSPITGITELPKPDVEINTINLKNDVEENKKPVVLLVPVESSEEIYDSHDEEQEEEEKEETTEEVEDVMHHNHKTKRCKSLNSFRTARRIPVAKVSRKYISASTESSIDESVENPIGGTSLFRVASVKDAKKILKNLLKSRSTKREDDVSSETVSKPQKQDSIKLVSKGSDRQGHKPKKYVCYCVEEDCDMKRPVKKPSRTYAVKKKIGTNILSKSSTNYEGQEIRDPGLLHHEDVLGSPNNLHCPPGAILMEELEYLAQLAATKRQKHNYRNRPGKNCPETIFPPDSEARSLGQPTKIHIPLGGNRKWNRRVYKVDGRAPFAQKLQSVFEQKETQDGIPCPEPESTYNEQQGLQDYYENEQNNYNQYNQMPVAPNPVYPPPYAVYPQYPQYPQYGEGYHDQIPMEPPQQDFISRQEPLLNQYMPTPLGRNFMDINQCIKLFGRNFCIITTTTIAPIPGPHYTNNCGEHEEPGMVAQWQENTHYTTKMPQVKTSKYPATVYNADEDTTHYHGLGVTRYHEENQHGAEKNPEDDAEREYGGRISSGFEYDRVTTSPYYSKPITVKIQSNDGTSRPSSYDIIGSEHEEHDYGDYDNFVGPESPIRHGSMNSEYLVPMEDSYDSESADYLGSSEETNENNVLQKISEENVTKGPLIAITKNLQGAHRISSPQYVQYTVTPVKGYSTSSSEDTSDETLEDTSGYIQTTQDSRLSDYDSSEIRYSTNKPDKDESIFSTIGRPEDESRTTLLMESQNKNELPSWQRVTTMYPIFDNEDHESNHQNDVHASAESDRAGANFELHTPKTTNSHRQFVGITQSTPVGHHSETEFISGTDTGVNNYYGSSHAPEDNAEDATTSLLASNEPEEPTYTSTTYSEMNNAEEIETDEDSPQEIEGDEENNNESVPTTLHYTTESRLGDTVHKYSTTKIHPYLQTKQAESNSDAASAETTTSYEKLVGKSQSTPMDNFEKPEFDSDVTVDGDNQYTTSTVNSKYGTTSLLRANEPEEQDVSSEEMNAEVTSSLNTSESGNDDTENTKYITTEKIFYPQAGSYETTLIDSSTEPEQVGDSFQTSSHQPFVESIPQSTSSNSLGKAEDISNEATSYTTMENSKYDTTPLLGANELEKNVFTSYSHYLTTPTDENKPGSLLQVPEEHDEVGTEEIPSTVHYVQNSEMAGMDQNKWTTAEEVTNSHPQFVGTIQSAPVTDFSQPEEVSPTKIGGKNYYTTSYATMKGTDNSKTAILKAKEPEEEVFGSTTNSWPQENEEKNQNNIEKTTWTQNYPTQSEIQKTSMDQLSTTDQYSHPQFVGSHQSTLVDSSTRQDQLEENFGAHETNTNQPFVESIGHSTSLSDSPKTEDISDAEISHVTMANSRYDSTSSLEAIEPEEREFTFYSRYPTTIETEEDTNVPLWQQETEEHDEDTTEKIPLSDYYITQSKNSGGDRNKWSNAGKTTSSRGQYVGVTQSTPNNDFLQNKDTSTTTYGINSYYSTSYATMENMDDTTSTVLGEKEPEEEIFRSTIDPTVQGKHQDNIDDTTWPQYYQTQSEIPETSMDQHFTTGKNSYPQFVGLHQSTVVDSSTQRGQLRENYNTLHKASSHQPFLGKISQSKTDFATTEDISDASTSYATMENSRYDTTPLLGETEPEENDFSSYSSYSTTIEPEADTTAWLKNTEERVGGKVTSSHPQFGEETRSTPVDYFSQPAVTSSSAIGGNSHYTTSYATMENSEYDTTPLLSATNPEEKDFTSYLPHSTAIEYKTDTTSPWLENTRKQNGVSTQKIPSRHYATHTVMAGMDNNKLMKSRKTTTLGSHPQFVGITQSTPADDFSQSGVASSSSIGSNSHYTISYATVDDMNHSKTTLLGAQEPEEEIFRPTTYPTIHHAEEMKTPSSWQQENTHNDQNNLEETTWNQYPTQSEVQELEEEEDFASYLPDSTAIEYKGDTTSPWLENTREQNGVSTQKIPSRHYATHTVMAGMDNNKWMKSGKTTTLGSHPQFVGITQSTPADDFSQSGVASSSTIGSNSHYTISYATVDDMHHSKTTLLGAQEPEEEIFRPTTYPTIHHAEEMKTPSSWQQENTHDYQNNIEETTWNQYPTQSEVQDLEEEEDFASYLPDSTAIEYKGDTTSPWLENTREQNGVSTQKIPSRHYTPHTAMAGMNDNKWTKSGKITTLKSHPQFVGITQSTPADDFSQSGVASSSTIGNNNHYTISYATVEDMNHSTTSLLGAREPEEEIFRSTTYPTIHHAEEMKTPSSWQQENTHNYQNNLEETTWSQYPTQSEVQDTTRGQHIATEENFYPQVGKSHQSTNEVLSSTGSNTEQYFTTGRNSHHQFSTEVPEDITFANNDEQSTNWYHSTGQQEATSQSDHRQFVGSHHSTTSPRFGPNSGIMEETNAYFTSKAYDDNINAVTGPDSYFEGGGLKNWNDFTSMSSDDFTIGNAIGAEEVKQPTTGDAFGPENEGWETMKSSQRQSTDYNVVGEEMPYKESTMNDEFSQDTTEDDYSAGHTIKTTNDNSHILYPGQRYENTLLTSTGKMTGEEDVGKPIYESDSSSPIADTHFFESHTGHPYILKSENKILETTSLENLGIDYTASSGKSTFSEERITQPNMKEIPFFDQSTNSYERKSNTIDDKSSPENEADEKALISHENISPSKDYDYTNDYITLDKSPTTEFSKDHEDASLQVLGNTLRNEPSLNQEETASSINYGDNMSSEDDLSTRSSESETVSNLSRSSTTTKSMNYEDYSDSSSTQEHEWHPNHIEEETSPTIDSLEEISSVDQLSPEEREILRSSVEKVVNDLISAKSDKPDKDGHIPPEVVGAPLLPGLPEMSILKNLFSLPEVKNMAIGTVKGLMSEISGVPQASSLGRLADHLIDSVLDGVINNILPGPITTTSSAIVDEHRYENGQWTVVPVTLVPKVNSSGQKPVDEVLSTTKHIVGEEPDDNVLGTTKDIVGQEPEDKVLSTIKDIVGRPGIGLQGARLPLVQNIIVRAVENTLRNAKNVVNHSVIWDTLNEVIARAEKSLLPTHGTTTTIKSTTTAKTTSKSLGVKKPGGPFKIAPVIPVTEHVFKDGKWDEKQTVLGAKKKNFGSSTSTISATDSQLRTSSSSYETSEEFDNQYDYTTKALDYALLGESEEDNEEQKYGTTGFVGITKEIPKNIKTLHDDEDDLDDSPIKYYSPKDRILSYKKNHQTPAGFVESQQKWQTTSGSLNNAPTEDYSTSTETASNELTENTESSAEFALVNQADDSVGSSEESTICTCAERKKMKNQQKVGSALRGSTEASTEEDNYFESTSTVYDSDERENSESSNYGEGNSLTTLQPRKKSGEELISTESSEFSSTIHHLDVDQDESNDDTTEENVADENPSVTEELGRNTLEDSQENLEEVETDSNESTSISNTKEHTNNMKNQITSTPVYVYGEPVERNKFSEDSSTNDGQTVESTDEEFIGGANVITTEHVDQTSDEASDKIMHRNETPTISDVTKQNPRADDHKHNDQDETTPVYVYGTPVNQISSEKTTNWDESETQNLREQFSEAPDHHDFTHGTTASILTGSQEKIGNPQFSGIRTIESHSNTESDRQLEEYSTEEYTKMENTLTTDNSRENSEDEVATEAAKSNESFSDVTNKVLQGGSKNGANDFSTRVYVNGEPIQETSTELLREIGDNQFQGLQTTESHSNTGSDGQPEEYVNMENTLTTDNSGENSGDELATEAAKSNESFSDVTDKVLQGGSKNGVNDFSTHVYVNGEPIQETTTELLREIGNNQSQGLQTTESHSDTGSDGQPDEYSTEESIKMENTLTSDNSNENPVDEVPTEAAKSNESFSDVTNEVLQAGNKNVASDFSTQVYVNGEPLQKTTKQLPRKHPVTLKSYISPQEATTSSQGLIGAAKSRNGRPGLPSPPRNDLERPRDDILKDSRTSSGGASNCMTPKYDPTYFGKISLNGVNPGGDSISTLMNSDLFYVGDGVRIPLTIQRMPDGSFALSISEKICENFVNRKCPCCVPREGDIVEEKRQSNEPEEYNAETSSKEDYNYDSFEPTESAEFHGKSKKRYVRSTSGSEVMVTSATPVKNFVKKYNLTLNLGKNHSPTLIRNNDEDAEEMRNSRRKSRLSSSRDTKLGNLYGNNNEIQRDDSEEIENRIIDASDSDTVSKESNLVRKAEYVFDTDTNDFIQTLLHIKDAPEDKRTEIVLNALDGLVNAGENSGSMDRSYFGEPAQEIPSNENPLVGSDEYDLNEMENEMARYGYQKDNPILERIRFIKAQQNSHGQYKYQKNIDHRAKGKMNILKTVLQWLKQVFLETNVNNKN